MKDATDAILERYALPAWRDWEADWKAGRISSRECLSRQVKLIRTDKDTLIRFAETLPIDPGIFELDRRSLERGIPFSIVSDGLDLVIQAILRHHGLQHIPVFANRLTWKHDGTPTLEFPYANRKCTQGAGTCKCELTSPSQAAGAHCIYIGDGQSDFCVSAKMDEVYAKGTLQEWCRKEGIRFVAYESLLNVADAIFPQESVIP